LAREAGARIGIALVAACAAALLGGCGASSGVLKEEATVPFTPEQQAALSRTEAMPYRIQRGDVLAVHFVDFPEYRQSDVLVLPDGSATFYGLGRIVVAGLSVEQADSLLTEGYSRQVLNPDLSVIVQDISGRQVYVLGQVNQPGFHQMPASGVSVLGAVALAGGFTDTAGKGSVVLVRISPEGYLYRQFDLSDVYKKGVFDPVLMDVQPYDLIYVSSSWIGDFADFSNNLIGSLLQYTQLVLDIRLIEDPNAVFRR
jgi:protein involved in polysaccharide export with SLBB domain